MKTWFPNECYADLTETERSRIREYSKALAHTLGLSGLSRIDFFRTKDGRILFNEINTIPGFTETSLYPKMMAESGVSPRDLVNLLIEDAAEN